MKLNVTNTVIAVALAALVSYLCYTLSSHESVRTLITAGSFFTSAIALTAALGLRVPEYPRTSVLLKTVSSIFSVLLIVDNIAFSFFDFSVPFYIILTGVMLVVFLLAYSSVYNAKQ